MSTIIDGSASVTINSGAVLGITSGTAVASTSGTSIDFTSLPAWVKRITVMLAGLSTSGTSNPIIQIGSGSVSTTLYASGSSNIAAVVATASYTTGFGIFSGQAANSLIGSIVLTNISSNNWVVSGVTYSETGTTFTTTIAGFKSLSGTLDRVRITTVNGTDTFDAGSINILYE